MLTNELCYIMDKHGSDKADGVKNWHNYTISYYEFFKDKKLEKINIFELGLGTNYTDVPSSMGADGIPGASLRGWKEFFPNAFVYGADIDRRILFEEERIKTYYVDQTNSQTITDMWNNADLKNIKFDIIIDDGLHDYSANINFLENSYNKLSDNGLYFIEDINNHSINNFDSTLNVLSNKFNFEYKFIRVSHPRNTYDNNLCVITPK